MKPIIFSGPMVRAILAGRKTVTRRVVKPQPPPGCEWSGGLFMIPGCALGVVRDCQHGGPGDRLWVRETFAQRDTDRIVAYRADGECGAWMGDGDGGRVWIRHGGIIEVAGSAGPSWGLAKYGGRWKPSIHMPRWASRLTLRITDVRVERLQEITEEDALAEGVDALTGQFAGCYMDGASLSGTTARECFARTWDALHGPGAWDRNEWVWRVGFEVAP